MLLPVLLIVIVNLSAALSSSDYVEIKCEEIKKLQYTESYNGSVCTFVNALGDSGSQYVIRTSNYYEYANKITEVVFLDSKLHDVPRQLFTTFRNLKSLNLNRCEMIEINKYVFDYANNLNELKMQLNNFEKLPNHVFTSAPNLQSIDATGNRISLIDDKTFFKLALLETLILSENSIKSLNEKMLAPLVNLKKLKLDSNKLEVIEENVFEQNGELTEIWLNNNDITIVNGRPFDKLTKLKLLNLAYNKLHKIDVENSFVEKLFVIGNKLTFLKINRSLKALIASYNEITEVDFNGNNRLLDIKLRDNKLTSLKSFANQKELENLDVSFNDIGDFEISTFSQMSSLSRLNLEYTNITTKSLNYGTFSHNTNLSLLDLSYNKLGKIDFSMFSALTSLSSFKIDGNNLTEIAHENIKTIFPRMILVSLSDNDWNCSYLATMLDSLKKANLVIFVPMASKILNAPNVAGIACHHEKTEHTNWRKPIVHDEDDPAEDFVPKRIRNNLTEINFKIDFLRDTLRNLSETVQQKLDNPSSQKIVDASDEFITKSQLTFMKFVLTITSLTLFGYLGFILTNCLKGKRFERRIFYPAMSTTTLQTSMEQPI